MNNDCKFCNKKGLMILPLRYSVAVADDVAKELAAIPALPGHLGEGVKDLTLAHGKYVPALLRAGYLYVLIERKGIKSWEGYYVTEDAYLYKFSAEDPPSTEKKIEFTCDPTVCGIDASMVSINKASDVEKVYFLFSPDPLTPAKLKEYKVDPDGMVAKKKMQVFNPKAWLAGTTSQPHALPAADMPKHTQEGILYAQAERALTSPLGKALANQLFPPVHSAYSGMQSQKNGGQPPADRLGVLYQSMRQRGAAAFVVYDPIGITQELNNFRNAALDELQPWLQAIDPRTKVTNERRLHVLGALDDVRQSIEKGVVEGQREFQSQHRQGSDQYFDQQMGTARQLRAMGRFADAEKVEREVRESRARRERNYAQAAANAPGEVWKKYAKKLHGSEEFRQQFNQRAEKHEKQLLARVEDHLHWLTSPRLVAAFEAYDKHHVANGQQFQDAVGLAMLGMNYTEAGSKTVLAWAQGLQVKPENLLLRAYALNQRDIEQATNQSLALAKTSAQGADGDSAWWKSLDLIQVNMKNATDAFDKANAALETIGKNHPFRSRFPGSGMAIYGMLGHAIFKVGIKNGNSWLGRVYIGALAAPLGVLNSHVRLSELAHAERPPVNLPDPRRSEGQGARRVREAIESQSAHGKTGEIYKLRLAAVIALIEAVGLFLRAAKEQKDTKAWLELTGSALALAAAGFEAIGVGVEFVQKHYAPPTMTGRGAAVALGGIKLFAGTLAAFGAGVGAAYDWMDAGTAKAQRKYPLAVALYTRSIAQGGIAGLGVVIGYSFSAPLFEHLAIRFPVVRGSALALARGAAWMSLRQILFLRVVACSTWITIGLTIALFLITDDALEEWCEKSSFRKDPRPGDEPFSNEGEELKRLYQAFNEVK